MHPVFLYNFIIRSFSYARVENQELTVGKVHERETLLDSEPLAVARQVLQGINTIWRGGGVGGSEEVDKDGPQGTFKD